MERLLGTNHEHLSPLLNIGLTREDRKSFSLGRIPKTTIKAHKFMPPTLLIGPN
jgi:hypothetical protein